jgi:endonuclease/exonuclease/phosphatase family metal-dependent hydrolase
MRDGLMILMTELFASGCSSHGGAADPSIAPVAVDSVAVVTWNVHVGAGDIHRLVTDLRSGALTGAPVAHFVLLVQESHRAGAAVPAHDTAARTARAIRPRPPRGARVSIDHVARDLELSLAYVPSVRNGPARGRDAEDRGNAILSTLPLRDVIALELPLARQRRVAVAASTDVVTSNGAGHTLQLVSVHLENRPARGLTGVRERQSQMVWLLDALPHASSSVLGGDFNTWRAGAREPAFTLAAARYPDTGTTDNAPTHSMPLLPDGRLDFLLARLPNGRLSGHTRVDDRYGSDHHPIMAWVHLN